MAQHLMYETFKRDERLRMFIGDVRDRQRLRMAMEGCEYVIHTAALKRVEVGESNPHEMVKTNVNGAANVIEAAFEACVRRVVSISSDKACEPLNAYGTSKLMAEKMFLAANNVHGERGPSYAVVRYGNVGGSTGSVIPLWRRLAAAGQRVQVTDLEATRFWISVAEAVALVLWALESDVTMAVPDLPSYRLGDLVEAMAVEANVVGLGPGEKKHETMLSEAEGVSFYEPDTAPGYWVRPRKGAGEWAPALISSRAWRLSVAELKERLADV